MINLVCIVDDFSWDRSEERFWQLLFRYEVLHIDVDLIEHEKLFMRERVLRPVELR